MEAQNPIDHTVERLASVLPRVLIVSRRTVRKNKFVNFVGEYHLDLVVSYGAVPIIVPRVTGLHLLLDSFEPIHGVLLCEGEDVDPALYENDSPALTVEEIEEVRMLHSSDTAIDKDKDSIEMQLARRCLERNIPYLGICRGSHVLNVACGGSLYQDVEKELFHKGGAAVKHINYENYDGHRHPINVIEGTPLHEWFRESLDGGCGLQLNVNSYHHQGVKKLATRFKPMAFSPCGLIEAFYDPDAYHPEEGKFIVGLQFHPERMRHEQDNGREEGPHVISESVFDYPGCAQAYQEFAKAVIAYQQRLLSSRAEKETVKLDVAMEKQRLKIVRSFSIAKHLYDEQLSIRKNRSVHDGVQALKALEDFQANDRKYLEVGANFLQSTMQLLNTQQEKRLKQVGVTVRNSSLFFERLTLLKDREVKARMLLERLGTHELLDVLEFYKTMVEATSEILESRRTRDAA